MISGDANFGTIGARAQACKDEAVVSAAGMVPGFTTGCARGALWGEKSGGGVAEAGGKVIENAGEAGRALSRGPGHLIGETLDGEINWLVEIQGKGKGFTHVAAKVTAVSGQHEMKAAVGEKGVKMTGPCEGDFLKADDGATGDRTFEFGEDSVKTNMLGEIFRETVWEMRGVGERGGEEVVGDNSDEDGGGEGLDGQLLEFWRGSEERVGVWGVGRGGGRGGRRAGK